MAKRSENMNVCFIIYPLQQQFADNTSQSTFSHMQFQQKEPNCISIWQIQRTLKKSQCVYLLQKEKTNVHHMCS